jgi:uncharacterized protein YwgA
MNNLIYALKELGFLSSGDIKFTMSSFKERLFFQKLIFLLNELTDELGEYSYNWFLRGPYSPTVADDLFSIQDIINNNERNISYFLSNINPNENLNDGIEAIKELKKAFKNKFNQDWNASDLEILASIVFIANHTSLTIQGSEEETIREFEKRKPELSNIHPVEKYYSLLKNLKIIE